MLTIVHLGFGALMGFRLPISALMQAAVAVGIETMLLIASFGLSAGVVIGLSFFFFLQIGYLAVLLGRTILEGTDGRYATGAGELRAGRSD